MKKKYLLTLFILSLTINIIFLVQFSNYKADYTRNNSEQLLYDNIIYFNKLLYNITETLELYKNVKTDNEVELFRNSINKDILSLNEVGKKISVLWPDSNILIYEDYIWQIENTLEKIIKTDIDKEDIQLISKIIKGGNKEINKIIYEEHEQLTSNKIYEIGKVIQKIYHEFPTINKI